MSSGMGREDGNQELDTISAVQARMVCTGSTDNAGGSGQQVEAPRKRIKCIVMSRIVGYYSGLDQWNDGKRQEFKDRKVYEVTV